MINDEQWQRIKELFPIGSTVSVEVRRQMPYGMFVSFPERPDAPAFIDAISYRPGGQDVPNHDEWPAVGTSLDATVADHVERNRQVRLRVGPPLPEKT